MQDIPKHYPFEGAPQDYKIIPGDQLKLAIYTLDEEMKNIFAVYISDDLKPLTGQNSSRGSDLLNVYSDGTVKIPYLGKINVEGKTIVEAKDLIAKRFAEDVSENIKIDIVLSNRYFCVLGEMGYRRLAMDKQRLNIFQALSLSGNIKRGGDRKKVFIIRQTEGGTTQYRSFDLRSKDIVDSEFYYIQPNDVIYMPRSNKTFVGVTSFTQVFGLITSVAGFATFLIRYSKKW